MIVSKESFARFIYPFTFDPARFEALAAEVDAATYKVEGHLWEKQPFPEDELLPHVARYLNPTDDSAATARLWRLDSVALDSLEGLGAGRSIDWRLVCGKKKELGFSIEDVQLSLFRVGVGFVTVRARLKSAEVERLARLHPLFPLPPPQAERPGSRPAAGGN